VRVIISRVSKSGRIEEEREREREREREDYLYALFVILIVVILVVTAFVAREQKIEADRSSRELSNASARRVLRRVIRKALKS